MVEVGSIIKIFNKGGCYPTFERWAKEHSLKNYIHEKTTPIERRYKVIARGKHSSNINRILLGLEDIETKQHYIFEEAYREYYEILEKQLEFIF